MEDVLNPYKNLVVDLSPVEFEKYCMNILKSYADKEDLKEFSIVHDKRISTSDGDYQIDIYCEFVAIGVKFKVLAECKKYKYPIEREKVAVLADKLHSIGAQKGILISTSGFQSGAAKYAKAHGIALIQIMDKYIRVIQNSAIPRREMLDKLLIEWYKYLPKYFAMEYDEYGFPREDIYPSRNEAQKIKEQFIKDNNGNIKIEREQTKNKL